MLDGGVEFHKEILIEAPSKFSLMSEGNDGVAQFAKGGGDGETLSFGQGLAYKSFFQGGFAPA